MLITRCPWGITTVLLCTLLLQNCQSQLNALEEESLAAAPPQSGWQLPASEALTQPFGCLPSLTLTKVIHQPQLPPAAFAGTSPSAGILPTASTTRSRNLFIQDSYRPFTASMGALVRFQQAGSQWQAVVQGGVGTMMYKRTLPVVSAGDISTQLASLQRQDVWASRSRIHIMATSYPPYTPCVYLGKSGLLGGMPTEQPPLAAAARSNEAGEALEARDQEIAQTSDVLAADFETKTFGAAEWEQYFGDVGSAPDLPADMATILDGPCPFWPNKKVRDTHLLVLIPATVGGVPFTLNQLGELIQHPKNGGHSTKYRFYGDLVKTQIGGESSPRSYWVLMTRDVLPDSRHKTYDAQKELVAAHASRLGLPYEMPHALAAATAILLHYAREGERLFGDDPYTYTRCLEVDKDGDPAVVGGFESSGLNVDSHYSYDLRCFGVSCCRKFF